MSEIENRQLTADGAESFERLIKDYSPVEFPPISKNTDNNQGAQDVAYQDTVNKQPSEPGNVSDSAKVVTVYDARPINAIDFTVIFNTDTGSATQNFNMTVPAGIVRILKNFSFFMNGDGIATTLIDQFGQEFGIGLTTNQGILFSISINGVRQPNYTNLNLGLYIKNHPCYIIADSNSVVTFSFNTPTELGNPASMILIVYGQDLLSSGRSINFEPGNVIQAPPVIKKPETYERYLAIMNKAKQLKLVHPFLPLHPFQIYKSRERHLWGSELPIMLNKIKNISGEDL